MLGDVTSVAPPSGVGGTQVVVSGQRLLGGGNSILSVHLAGVQATVTDESNTAIELVVTTITDARTGDVVIIANSGAVITEAQGWTYEEPGAIIGVTPNVGQFDTRVVISGTRLLADGTDLVSVTLGGIEVQSKSVTGSVALGSGSGSLSSEVTEISVVADRSAAQANADVLMIVDTGGRVTAAGAWTYAAEGTIVAVSPGVGHEGAEISIFGTSLRGQGSQILTVTLAGVGATITRRDRPLRLRYCECGVCPDWRCCHHLG